jgi:DNA repair protein RadA/Sms
MALFLCTNCGNGSASWFGRCPDCGQWNTMVEKPEFSKSGKNKSEAVKKISITPLGKIKSQSSTRVKTGISEFDRVTGGGMVRGEVILLTGEPGIGKSTLVLQTLKDIKTLYISGEESGEQVKNRADRLGIGLDNFLFSQDLQIESIIETVSEMQESVDLIIIDSIQTVYSKDVEAGAASVSQLKEVTKKIVSFAKKNDTIVIIIGHVTKEGVVAGPKTLEHFVDCVLNFEGEKVSNHRLLRASKNRYGGTDEIGIFEMTAKGLKEAGDPLLFVEEKEKLEVGRAVVGVAQGNRPLFFEIQSLASPTVMAYPRRVVKGLDYNKVQLLIAVAQKYLHIPLDRYDIYINVIGGVSITSTSSDLGLIAALISSFKNIPLPKNSLFLGEVGLLGEVRKTYFEEKIISDAKRLGFKKIYSGKQIENVRELKALLG